MLLQVGALLFNFATGEGSRRLVSAEAKFTYKVVLPVLSACNRSGTVKG